MKLRVIPFLALIFISLCSFINTGDEFTTKFYTGSYDNLLREARKQHKPIILDFWASWCGPCKKMDNETFADPALAKFIAQNYLIYKVDIDTFDGMEITDKFSIESFPSLLILNEKGKALEKFKGFYPPHYLEKELKQVLDRNNIISSESESHYAVN